ncbi:hypothetical protein LCGC14_2216060 [marine sediment metagenome]|uniref:Uncharacterized protein n=1 Tax=marine sediment metagenome TaxID=412755 RepID=A0A0F9DZU2_9ZZZZ
MKKQRERFQDILVLSTKKGRIKISVQGGYTAKEMYQASEHMLVMAGKRYAREKKNGEGNG